MDWFEKLTGFRETTYEETRAKGRAGGRKPKLTADQRQEAIQMIGSGQKSAADVARLFKVHPPTVSRLLAQSTVARPGSRQTRAAGA